jgi:hypothetical protein
MMAMLDAQLAAMNESRAVEGEWAVVQRAPRAPRETARKRGLARSTLHGLRSLLRLWRLWEERKAVLIGEKGPTWEQVAAYRWGMVGWVRTG